MPKIQNFTIDQLKNTTRKSLEEAYKTLNTASAENNKLDNKDQKLDNSLTAAIKKVSKSKNLHEKLWNKAKEKEKEKSSLQLTTSKKESTIYQLQDYLERHNSYSEEQDNLMDDDTDVVKIEAEGFFSRANSFVINNSQTIGKVLFGAGAASIITGAITKETMFPLLKVVGPIVGKAIGFAFSTSPVGAVLACSAIALAVLPKMKNIFGLNAMAAKKQSRKAVNELGNGYGLGSIYSNNPFEETPPKPEKSQTPPIAPDNNNKNPEEQKNPDNNNNQKPEEQKNPVQKMMDERKEIENKKSADEKNLLAFSGYNNKKDLYQSLRHNNGAGYEDSEQELINKMYETFAKPFIFEMNQQVAPENSQGILNKASAYVDDTIRCLDILESVEKNTDTDNNFKKECKKKQNSIWISLFKYFKLDLHFHLFGKKDNDLQKALEQGAQNLPDGTGLSKTIDRLTAADFNNKEQITNEGALDKNLKDNELKDIKEELETFKDFRDVQKELQDEKEKENQSAEESQPDDQQEDSIVVKIQKHYEKVKNLWDKVKDNDNLTLSEYNKFEAFKDEFISLITNKNRKEFVKLDNSLNVLADAIESLGLPKEIQDLIDDEKKIFRLLPDMYLENQPGPEEAKPEEGKPEEGKPEEVKPEEVKPEEGKPEEVKPEEGKPEEVKPEEVKPEEVKPEEGKPEEVKPEEGKPEEVKPEEVKPEEVKPEEGKPVEGKPEEVKPEEVKPEEVKPEGEQSVSDQETINYDYVSPIYGSEAVESPAEEVVAAAPAEEPTNKESAEASANESNTPTNESEIPTNEAEAVESPAEEVVDAAPAEKNPTIYEVQKGICYANDNQVTINNKPMSLEEALEMRADLTAKKLEEQQNENYDDSPLKKDQRDTANNLQNDVEKLPFTKIELILDYITKGNTQLVDASQNLGIKAKDMIKNLMKKAEGCQEELVELVLVTALQKQREKEEAKKKKNAEGNSAKEFSEEASSIEQKN